MTRSLLAAFGLVLSLLGLVLMVSPIPGSSLLLASGIAMLICGSDLAARCLQYFRARWSVLNRALVWLEDRAGESIGAALRRSKPDELS